MKTVQVTWNIKRKPLSSVPLPNDMVLYTGHDISPEWDFYNPEECAMTGVHKAAAAGIYQTVFTPRPNYCWPNGSTTPIAVTWEIPEPVRVALPSQVTPMRFVRPRLTEKFPEWNDYDPEQLELEVEPQFDMGTYTATFTPKPGFCWEDDTTVTKTVEWVIEQGIGRHWLSNTNDMVLTVDHMSEERTYYTNCSGYYPSASGRTPATFVKATWGQWNDDEYDSEISDFINSCTLELSAIKKGTTAVRVYTKPYTEEERGAPDNYSRPDVDIAFQCICDIPSNNLTECTWDEIKSAVDAGVADKFWQVGDLTALTPFQGSMAGMDWDEQFNYRIVDLQPDSITFQLAQDEDGKEAALVTVPSYSCVPANTPGSCMNRLGMYGNTILTDPGNDELNYGSNRYGYGSSYMCRTTMPEFELCVPEDLRRNVQRTTIWADNHGNDDWTAEVSEIQAKFWLASRVEVSGSTENINVTMADHTSQFEWYADGNFIQSVQIYPGNHTTDICRVWLRDPTTDGIGEDSFAVIRSQNVWDANGAARALGIKPCFRIAKDPEGAVELQTVIQPSQQTALTYNFNAQSPSWKNYNTSELTLSGTTSGTNADTYEATFTPKNGFCWGDGSTGGSVSNWIIDKAVGTAVWDNASDMTLTVDHWSEDRKMTTNCMDGMFAYTGSNNYITTEVVGGGSVKAETTKTFTLRITAKGKGQTSFSMNPASEGPHDPNHTLPNPISFNVNVNIPPSNMDCSWQDVQAAVNAGVADKIWEVGLLTPVNKLQGNIAGLDVNDYFRWRVVNITPTEITFMLAQNADGREIVLGKGGDFMSSIPANGSGFCMNRLSQWGIDVPDTTFTNTNKFGYDKCYMDAIVMRDFYNAMPDTMKAVVANKPIGCIVKGNGVTTADGVAMLVRGVYLPSQIEILGISTGLNSELSEHVTQFEWFKDANNRSISMRINNTSMYDVAFWTRDCVTGSSSSPNTTTYRAIDKYDDDDPMSSMNYNASMALGIKPIFRVSATATPYTQGTLSLSSTTINSSVNNMFNGIYNVIHCNTGGTISVASKDTTVATADYYNNGTIGSRVVVKPVKKGSTTVEVSADPTVGFITPKPVSFIVNSNIPSSNLSECTWQEMQDAVNAGVATKLWQVGDLSPFVKFQGRMGDWDWNIDFNFRIVNLTDSEIMFQQAQNRDGVEIALTSLYKSYVSAESNGMCMNRQYRIGSGAISTDSAYYFGTNIGGCASSYGSRTIMGQYANCLPSAITSIWKLTPIWADNTGNKNTDASAITLGYQGGVFLLSVAQITNAFNRCNANIFNKVSRLQWYQDTAHTSMVVYRSDQPNTAAEWWLRDPATDRVDTFVVMGEGGGLTTDRSCLSIGLRPAFCLRA